MGEDVLAAVLLRTVALQTVGQIRRDLVDVGAHDAPRLVALDDQAREILVEQVADDLDQHVRLFVHRLRLGALAGLRLTGTLVDVLPQSLEALHVGLDGVLGHALRGGADDRARPRRRDLLEDLLQTLALRLRQLARNAGAVAAGDVDQEPAGQRNLHGQAGALVAQRVLRRLHQHLIAGLERVLDAPGTPGRAEGPPVDVRRIQHAVAVGADVDERGLHARQHVLHAAEVDVADDRRLRVRRDEVLHQQIVLQHADLRDHAVAVVAAALAHHHRALDGLAAGQELRLGDHVALAGLSSAIGAAPALGLQASRALDGHRLVDDRHLGLVIVVRAVGRAVLLGRLVAVVVLGDASIAVARIRPGTGLGVGRVPAITIARAVARTVLGTAATATAATAAARARLTGTLVVGAAAAAGAVAVGIGVVVVIVVVVGGVVHRFGDGVGRCVGGVGGNHGHRLGGHEHRDGERRLRRRRGDRRDDLDEVIVLGEIGGRAGRRIGGGLGDGLGDVDVIGRLRRCGGLGHGPLDGATRTRTAGGLLRLRVVALALRGGLRGGLSRGGGPGVLGDLGSLGHVGGFVDDGLGDVDVIGLLRRGSLLAGGALGRALRGLLGGLLACARLFAGLVGDGLLRRSLLGGLVLGRARRLPGLLLLTGRLDGGRRDVVTLPLPGNGVEETIPIGGDHGRRRRLHGHAQFPERGDQILRRDAHGLRQGMHAHPVRSRCAIEITGIRHGVVAEIQHDMRFSLKPPGPRADLRKLRAGPGAVEAAIVVFLKSVVIRGVLRSTSFHSIAERTRRTRPIVAHAPPPCRHPHAPNTRKPAPRTVMREAGASTARTAAVKP